MVRRVMIAIDGKKQSEHAFDWYLNNIRRPNDEILIFHCFTFQLHVGLPGIATNVENVSKQVEDAKRVADGVTGHAADILKQKGLKGYVVKKSSAKPDEEILLTAEEEKVDYIVMGTRDLGSLKRALIGSVSTEVVRHAKCPVTVVKSHHGH